MTSTPEAAPPTDQPRPRRLVGRTAIVTGGSGGLGSAFSLALANAGANVAVAFIGNPAPAQTLVAQIQALGAKSIALEADITDPAAVKAMLSLPVFGGRSRSSRRSRFL